MKAKLTSRKFWLSAAAFLGSIGASVAALMADNQIVAGIGIVCAMLSSAIYAGCESYVDSARAEIESTTDAE